MSILRHGFAPAHGQARARELVQQKYERIAADFDASAADIASTLTQIVSASLVRRGGGIWLKPQRRWSINRCHESLVAFDLKPKDVGLSTDATRVYSHTIASMQQNVFGTGRCMKHLTPLRRSSVLPRLCWP